MMSKRLLSLLTLLLLVSILLAACKPTPTATPITPTTDPKSQPTEKPTEKPTEPSSSVKGTIVLWHAWREHEIAGLNDVIQAFKARYPEVQFDVLYVPYDDLRGKYETLSAAGGGPSLLIGAADWGPMLYDAGLVSDITDLASADLLSSLNPAALGAVRYKGALIGLPHTIKGVVMFRNKAIIPEAPKTFAELVTKAKAATQGDVTGAYLEYGFFFSAAHITACGGKLMEANGDPAEPAQGFQRRWPDGLLHG